MSVPLGKPANKRAASGSAESTPASVVAHLEHGPLRQRQLPHRDALVAAAHQTAQVVAAEDVAPTDPGDRRRLASRPHGRHVSGKMYNNQYHS